VVDLNQSLLALIATSVLVILRHFSRLALAIGAQLVSPRGVLRQSALR
jgi:hypothetical protein